MRSLGLFGFETLEYEVTGGRANMPSVVRVRSTGGGCRDTLDDVLYLAGRATEEYSLTSTYFFCHCMDV